MWLRTPKQLPDGLSPGCTDVAADYVAHPLLWPVGSEVILHHLPHCLQAALKPRERYSAFVGAGSKNYVLSILLQLLATTVGKCQFVGGFRQNGPLCPGAGAPALFTVIYNSNWVPHYWDVVTSAPCCYSSRRSRGERVTREWVKFGVS